MKKLLFFALLATLVIAGLIGANLVLADEGEVVFWQYDYRPTYTWWFAIPACGQEAQMVRGLVDHHHTGKYWASLRDDGSRIYHYKAYTNRSGQLYGYKWVGSWQPTGETWQLTGRYHHRYKETTPLGFPFSYSTKNKLLLNGPDGVMVLNYRNHITINANGEITADVDHFAGMRCK